MNPVFFLFFNQLARLYYLFKNVHLGEWPPQDESRPGGNFKKKNTCKIPGVLLEHSLPYFAEAQMCLYASVFRPAKKSTIVRLLGPAATMYKVRLT